jgi:hypothetical protein
MNPKDTWNQNVEKARLALKTQKSTQMAVAALALDACEVKRGGTTAEYTLTRFAKEIGMESRLLSTWCLVYRKVYLKLAPQLQQKASYTQMMQMYTMVSSNAPASEVNSYFENEFVTNRRQRTIKKYGETLVSLLQNLERPVTRELAGRDLLEELLYGFEYGAAMIRAMGLKPVDHGTFKAGLTQSNIARKIALGQADLPRTTMTAVAKEKLATSNQVISVLKDGPKRLVDITRALGTNSTKNKLNTLRMLRKLARDKVVIQVKNHYLLAKARQP